MTRIEHIEREIQELSAEELASFRKWYHEFDAEVWDRQIAEDAQSGKLDHLAEAALKSLKAGDCSEL